jgi:hypothetical protein
VDAKGRRLGVRKREHPTRPAFTFFPRDYLGWSAREYLSPAQRGDLLDLIATAADSGTGTLAPDHPILDRLDPTVLRLALVREGDVLAVRQPFDLPGLLARRELWIAGKVRAGEASATARRAAHGTAQPPKSGTHVPQSSNSVRLPAEHLERNGTERKGIEGKVVVRAVPSGLCDAEGCKREACAAVGGRLLCSGHAVTDETPRRAEARA